MKNLMLIIVLANLFSHSGFAKSDNRHDNLISLKSVLKGVYEFSDDKTGKGNHFYYYIEVNLINNSKAPIHFLTTTCSTGANIIIDSEDFVHCITNCNGNSITQITLDPKQVFSTIILIRTKKRDHSRYVRFGWVLINGENNPMDYYKILDKSIKESENLIWGNPIEIQNAGGTPYDIK